MVDANFAMVDAMVDVMVDAMVDVMADTMVEEQSPSVRRCVGRQECYRTSRLHPNLGG